MAHRIAPASLAGLMVLAAGTASSAQQPMVRLKYATFDPAVSLPLVSDGLRAADRSRLWLVQFASTPTEDMRDAVRKHGGEVLRFATDHTHLVRVSADAIPALRELPCVRWVGPYHPAYRVDSSKLEAMVAGAAEHGGARYSIEVLDDAGRGRVADAIVAAGGLLEFVPRSGLRLEATLTYEQVLKLVRLDDVNFVDPTGPPGADMDIVRQLVGATPTLANAGFTGRGVRGEVFDTGIDLTHPGFQNPPPLIHFSSPGTPDHGTSIYGILFGNDPANPAATGLLPDAEQGIFCRYTVASTFGGPVTNRDLIAQLIAPAGPYRAVFQTRAVGAVQGSNYTTISAEMDAVTFEHDFLICQSMGDTGNMLSRPESWAKNVVASGGLNHNNSLTRIDDSGGPNIMAADGRFKPDLVAPRDNINTAAPGGYTTFGGVSAATGILGGCFGLATQMWHEGVWAGFGGGASVFADRPHVSTIRALVVNAAYQYDWTGGDPNIPRGSQGWGVPDLAAMYALRGRTFIVNETDPLVPLQTRSYTVHVLPGEPALKATMVYLDPAGNPAAAHARINDLSLRVTSPAQVQYWGNSGLRNGVWSPPGGQANTVDVIENVFVQNPASGTWTIEVIGSEIVQDARLESPALDADFALVVSGVSCYANCDASTTPPVLTANDFQCFLNKFVAGDPYANCDNSTGSPTLTANDFQCFVTRFTEPCP
jgi:serine protease AprX